MESEFDSGDLHVCDGDQKRGGAHLADSINESTSICVYIMFTVVAFRTFQSVMRNRGQDVTSCPSKEW